MKCCLIFSFPGSEGREHHSEIFQSCSELMIGMNKAPFPIIAEVNGIAAAAGCQFVASCDIVIASDKSSFVTPGANFGIFCSTPGIPLVRNTPKKVAADMLLTGLPLSAREAFNAGLVSAVVPEEDLQMETQKRVDAICNKSRSVVELGKKFMYEQISLPLEDAYRFGKKVMVDNVNMKDGQEGIQSFIQKRKPVWTHERE
ncbi:UNVERIFIED_CONTAM: hypothetical protein GTU68_056613 [Idotea baltica]|nr:hypothetical protein [Idotea baltica]